MLEDRCTGSAHLSWAWFTLCLVSGIVLAGLLQDRAEAKEPVDYVDCFVGTSNSRWMLGPYAGRPFGTVQLGPDNQNEGWMAGYEYAISNVSGFSFLVVAYEGAKTAQGFETQFKRFEKQ